MEGKKGHRKKQLEKGNQNGGKAILKIDSELRPAKGIFMKRTGHPQKITKGTQLTTKQVGKKKAGKRIEGAEIGCEGLEEQG